MVQSGNMLSEIIMIKRKVKVEAHSFNERMKPFRIIVSGTTDIQTLEYFLNGLIYRIKDIPRCLAEIILVSENNPTKEIENLLSSFWAITYFVGDPCRE